MQNLNTIVDLQMNLGVLDLIVLVDHCTSESDVYEIIKLTEDKVA